MLNMKKLLYVASNGHPEKIYRVFGWSIFDNIFKGVPYAFLLGAILEIFKPIYEKGGSIDMNTVMLYALGQFIALVIHFFIARKTYLKEYYTAYGISSDTRISMGDKLRKLSMGYFKKKDPGDLSALLVTDITNVETIVSHTLPKIVGSVMAPILLIIALLIMNWKLGLAAISVIPVAFLSIFLSNYVIRKTGEKHMRSIVNASSRMLEYLNGMKLIKSFNLTGDKFKRLSDSFDNLMKDSIKLEASSGPTVISGGIVLSFGYVIIFTYGLALFMSGELSLPYYLIFLILGSKLYEPYLQTLVMVAENTYYSKSAERLEEAIKQQPLPEIEKGAKINNYDISFDRVNFKYDKVEVLKNISFNVKQNEKVALVGPSGSGKSTITRLLARFWDVNAGSISMGGKDIRSLEMDYLLSKISIVFQDVYLFNDTIANNIKIGKENASMDEIINAAKAARCHEFISKLPQGYDTVIGEGGNTLSGGEKQRVSIARAILKDAPIILLDEATASIDPENEICIQQAIDDLVKDKTLVVIAHRLSTIRNADKIVVIDEGNVIEQGKHDELIENKGKYKHMWDEQKKSGGWKFRRKVEVS